jgi:hypothetical protein
MHRRRNDDDDPQDPTPNHYYRMLRLFVLLERSIFDSWLYTHARTHARCSSDDHPIGGVGNTPFALNFKIRDTSTTVLQ